MKNINNIPMISVGNNELEKMLDLKDTIKCWICGKEHKIQHGERVNDDGTKDKDTTLAFIECSDKTYLCGINNKEWKPLNIKRK